MSSVGLQHEYRSFLLTFPALIESGSDAKFCASLLKPNESLTMTMFLVDEKNRTTQLGQQRSSTEFHRCFSFQAPRVDGELVQKLRVLLQGRFFKMTEERKVMFRSYLPLTFIQTDKPIYNPGQTVKFRVVTVDAKFVPLDQMVFNLLPVRSLSDYPLGVEDEQECLNVRPRRAVPTDQAYEAFKSVGMKVATNLLVREPHCLKYRGLNYYRNFHDVMYLNGPVSFAMAAAPRAESTGGEGSSSFDVTVRTDFPETWIWQLAQVGDTGSTRVPLKVPDTITTWETEAFCLSSKGFGLAPPVKLTVFQPFFLELSLPYSIIRGESFELKATIFNYLSKCIMVKVIPAPSSNFTLQAFNEPYSSCLCANGRKTFKWILSASVLGSVNVTVSARAEQSRCGTEVVTVPERGRIDVVTRRLLVLGGVGDNVTMTGYVAASLLELGVLVTDPVITNALSCLRPFVGNLGNTYATALLAYTFSLAGETSTRSQLLNALNSVATSEGTKLHWSQTASGDTLAVEISSYVLLAVLSVHPLTTANLSYANRIVNWLVAQQNPYGGFSSTQDTVVALHALSLYATEVFSLEGSNTVTVQSLSVAGEVYNFDVTRDNRLLYQEKLLKNINGRYSVEAKGSTCVSVQVACFYNIPTPIKVARTLSVEVKVVRDCKVRGADLMMFFTVSYDGPKPTTNMVIVDIKLLSGFTADTSLLGSPPDSLAPLVQQVDAGADRVLVYLKEVPKGVPMTYRIQLKLVLVVQNLKPAVVEVYDYYQPSDSFETTYLPPCP